MVSEINKVDEIKNPIHYFGDGTVQCKDALRSMLTASPLWLSAQTVYWWGCVLKYLWRWPNKNKVKDIDKAMRCLEYMRESAIEDIAQTHGIDIDETIEVEMYDE